MDGGRRERHPGDDIGFGFEIAFRPDLDGIYRVSDPRSDGRLNPVTEYAALADGGIVDGRFLVIGVIDVPDATSVRVTSPDGFSVVVPTGPVNRVIDGRFFLATFVLDASDAVRLDRFTIEDASP